MDINKLKKRIRNIPDFPKKGIQFKDITTLLKDHNAFNDSIDIFYNEFKDQNIDTVVGVESRGFIFAAPLALKLRSKLVIARKPNKLPAEKISQRYELEYGSDLIEMHCDSIRKNDRVIIIDDLLATGGTANAVSKLVSRLEGNIISVAFLIELTELKGCDLLKPHNVFSILNYWIDFLKKIND